MINLFNIVKNYGPLCFGLDPNIERMPDKDLFEYNDIFYVYDEFCRNLLRLLKDVVKIVKFQSAYFEAVPHGLTTLKHLISDANKFGYYTILDAKRSDISTTAKAYAQAAFDLYDADALTILPFMGERSIRTFVDYARKKGRQIFVVVHPTEASIYCNNAAATLELIQQIGDENINNGYGDVGAVVSGIMPNYIDFYRKIAPRVFFLVPGMGSQGGKVEDQLSGWTGNGTILSYSSSIIYATEPLVVVNTILDEINKCSVGVTNAFQSSKLKEEV